MLAVTKPSSRDALQGKRRVKLENTRSPDIEKFVPRESIDGLYCDMPYHLVTSGKIEAFAVIRAGGYGRALS